MGRLGIRRIPRSALRSGLSFAILVLLPVVLRPILAEESEQASESTWTQIEPGLDLGKFRIILPTGEGSYVTRILRIDPARFELRLLNASASTDGRALTPKEWADKYDLLAVTNASMYQEDGRTSVSLMRTRTHTNHGRISKDNAVLAFDRLEGEIPPAQIIDRTCQDFDRLSTKYGTLVQSIRMISCRGTNVWTPQPQKVSTAAIGMDQSGRILFIHVQTPETTHDVINGLLSLPIKIKNAMYVEGGRQAQLFVRASGWELELAGIYDNSLVSADLAAWPIPNVIGVARKAD